MSYSEVQQRFAQIPNSPYAHTADDKSMHAVRVLLCQYFGMIPDSGTSIQQGFASDVLVSIDECMCRLLLHVNLMYGSVTFVVTCLELQSDTCISNHHSDGAGLNRTHCM